MERSKSYLVDGVEFRPGDRANLIFDRESGKAYEIFTRIVAEGAGGLYIGSEIPERAREMFKNIVKKSEQLSEHMFNETLLQKKIADIKCRHLAPRATGGEYINFDDVDTVTTSITDHVRESGQTVTLLELDQMLAFSLEAKPVIQLHLLSDLSNKNEGTGNVLLVRTDPGVWKDDFPRVRTIGRKIY